MKVLTIHRGSGCKHAVYPVKLLNFNKWPLEKQLFLALPHWFHFVVLEAASYLKLSSMDIYIFLE